MRPSPASLRGAGAARKEVTTVILSEDDPDLPARGNTLLPEEWIAVALFGSATILAGMQILLREAFDIGIAWSQETIVVLMIWSVYFGASGVTARRRHVRMDLLATSIAPLPGALLETLAASLVLVYVAVITVLSWKFLLFVWHSNEFDPSTEMPGWLLVSGFPLGLTATVFRAAVDLRARTRQVARHL